MSDATETAGACPYCGHDLPAKGKTGPAKTYCDRQCRRRARFVRDEIAGRYVRKPRVYRTSLPSRWKHRSGDRFASLVILERRLGGGALCKCDCGNEKVFQIRNLTAGQLDCADRSRHLDPRINTYGNCANCDAPFFSTTYARFCSKKCSDAAPKGVRRRAIAGGISMSPKRRAEVFERDGWICQLCDLPLNREVSWPHSDYPTIDHIMPLAHGGAHAPSNWQSAHSLCNNLKNDHIPA